MSGTKYNKFHIKGLNEFSKAEKQVKPETVSVEEPQVTIQLLQHGRCTYTSPHTGKEYSWARAGSRAKVSKKDVGFLLAITKKVGGCCGSKPQYIKVFKSFMEVQ